MLDVECIVVRVEIMDNEKAKWGKLAESMKMWIWKKMESGKMDGNDNK